MPVHKPFNQGNYEANDASGKEAVTKFLVSQGLSVKENPNRYGVDLIADGITHNGKTFNKVPIEVERRQIWNRDEFPYSTVHVPERKTKFLKDYILYAVVNKDYTKVMFCSSNVITRFMPVEVPNNSISKDEYFYNVPLEHWKVYNV